MTAHTHAGFQSRGQVADHLTHGHGWVDEYDGRVGLPSSSMKLGDGTWVVPTVELLGIHRELHALDPQFIFYPTKGAK